VNDSRRSRQFILKRVLCSHGDAGAMEGCGHEGASVYGAPSVFGDPKICRPSG
jgi:hypothetical protein